MTDHTYDGLSALETLNYFRGKYYNDGTDTENGILAQAINELLPKLDKMSHIMAMEYTHSIGSYEEQRVAIFDDREVSEAEVKDCICRGECYHPAIAFIYKTHFDSIFKSGTETHRKDDRSSNPQCPDNEDAPAEPVKSQDLGIEELRLSTRAYNALKRAGIATVRDLLECGPTAMQCMEGIGRKLAGEILGAVKSRGYSWSNR